MASSEPVARTYKRRHPLGMLVKKKFPYKARSGMYYSDCLRRGDWLEAQYGLPAIVFSRHGENGEYTFYSDRKWTKWNDDFYFSDERAVMHYKLRWGG